MRANLGNTLLKHPRFSSLQASSVFFFWSISQYLWNIINSYPWLRDKEHALIVRVFFVTFFFWNLTSSYFCTLIIND
jgi:hypothetical protein